MKRRLVLITLTIFIITAIFASSAYAANGKPGRKIVIFDQKIVNENAKDAIVKGTGGAVLQSLPIVNGASVYLPDDASEKALKGKPGVLRIDDDVEVYALGKPSEVIQLAQTLPWGVNKIDADLAWPVSIGLNAKVAVIDTGISKTHPDLVTNIKGGINFVVIRGRIDPTNWNDDNGHGTHVAGITAAVNNSIGVIGVAPSASLYGVKVLNKNGSGYLSDVIAGINWAVNNGMDVINMSLGTNSDIQSLHDAVDNAYNAGVVVVAAAGNDGDTYSDDDVDYPARYSSVIAVAATNSSNIRASWSSDGPEVELAAPGVSIYSTYKGNSYATLSGTSMASPHVAGTAALILANNPVLTPAEVRTILQNTADDLGVAGIDNYYGYGLVDAEESVTGIQTNP
ncbi:MAG: S8 family peptidase [Actinobacteria bacterium]|nr:S8 family peptidase [Actinomycetota bacterium]